MAILSGSDDSAFWDSDDEQTRKTRDRFLNKMTSWAKRALQNVRETTGNFEDVVSSALRTHQRRQQDGEIASPETTDQIWDQLRTCLNVKIDKYRRACRAKKNSATPGSVVSGPDNPLAWQSAVPDNNPTPEHVDAYVQDALQLLDGCVLDPQIREIARLTMMSYTPDEIAQRCPLSVHQVRRRLDDLRVLLKRQANAGD